MIGHCTRWATDRSRIVLGLALFLCVAAGLLGAGVKQDLLPGGFVVPSAESTRAQELLAERFGSGEPSVVIVVGTPAGADDPATRDRGTRFTADLAARAGVSQATSYWSLGGPPALRSERGDSALVFVQLRGDESEVIDATRELMADYGTGYDGLSLSYGGRGPVSVETTDQTQRDLVRAELIIIPVTLIVLVIVFRGLVAAALPLLLGLLSIVGTLAVLRVLTWFTDVSVFAMNMTTGLGLGLGIDYSLFIISRFREELARGASPREAIGTTLRTAGRTVVFSAVTVILCLAAMLLFPMYFLRSFAYAGIAVVLLAMVAAVTVLPAVLYLLGPRVDRWSLRRRAPRPVERGMWHRIATVVMRRPLPVATGVIALLALLAWPFLGIKVGFAGAQALPRDAGSHRVHDILADDYPSREAQSLTVVADRTGDPAGRRTDLAGYAAALSRLPNVTRVDSLAGSYVDGAPLTGTDGAAATARFAAADATWLSVVPSVEPFTDAGRQLVRDVRATDAPFDVAVGGPSAQLEDAVDGLLAKLPWALGVIAVSLFALLFLLTGSIVVPLKAFVLNLLSLSATFGSMVWIFQDGHLVEALGGFVVTGYIVVTMPIMIFCIAFGLSMDYEVFLLSRIKEEYDAGGDNTAAVAHGLERTGSIVSAAALLVGIVFLSFLSSDVIFMKMLGLGLALAVLLDATVVRGALVPAFMRLAGRANWWAPGPLRRFHARFGLRESDTEPAGQPVPQPAGHR
ncbi:MMPL family transporter [Micromonospora sp. CPCC 206060]|uniref:MMPL family transporter n=1 Tax=Micromonospora sp. CPCC 206060 TaxID=3122406 RepID=UPI002FF23ADE